MNIEKLLPVRRNGRCVSHDYSSTGAYFVTICSHKKKCIFSRIANEESILNPIGKILQRTLFRMLLEHPNTRVDEYIIMPNHIHFIVYFFNDVGDKSMTLSRYVLKYKSITFKLYRDYCLSTYPGIEYGKLWQRSFWDRVVRADELETIREYIRDNPRRWRKKV